MPGRCCVLGCISVRGSCPYGFSRLPLRWGRLLWLRKIGRKNWRPTKSTCICDRHFINGEPSSDPRQDDFIPTLHLKPVNKRSVRVLKRAVVVKAAQATKVFRSLSICLFEYASVLNDTLSKLSDMIFSCCVHNVYVLCSCNSLNWLKLLLHSEHLYGLFHVWTLIWLPDWLNTLSHMQHLCISLHCEFCCA